MPKYKCINESCKNYNIIIDVSNVSLVYSKIKGKVVDSGINCPLCNNDRIFLRDKDAGMTTTMLGSENICKK